MTETTSRFALPLLQSGQAQKEVFHNEALALIDALLHPTVTWPPANATPADPAVGAIWIVGQGTGEWAGHDGELACWTDGGWRFVRPTPGITAWAPHPQNWVWHDGTVWRDDPSPVSGVVVAGKAVIGAQQPAIVDPTGGGIVDEPARQILSTILNALREHGLIAR